MKRLYSAHAEWGLQVSFKKIQYLVINSDACFEVLTNEDVLVRQVKCFKYLGVTIDKNGASRRSN